MKKHLQLGMNAGTAAHRLRKSILFSLIVKLKENVCFRCGKVIESESDLSIEHKVPWLDSNNPVELFFSLDNIAYSHSSCNFSAARKYNKKYFTKEGKLEAQRRQNAKAERKRYTTELRRVKYQKEKQKKLGRLGERLIPSVC